MFSPTRDQARQFFFDAWRKYRAQSPLDGLDKTAIAVILLHPEYHPLLDDAESNLEREFSPDAGALNPFLHLSLHLAISEQLSIDQPRGIRDLHAQLLARIGSEHDALHVLLECLGETVWQAQRDQAAPDEGAYLECIRRQAGLDR